MSHGRGEPYEHRRARVAGRCPACNEPVRWVRRPAWGDGAGAEFWWLFEVKRVRALIAGAEVQAVNVDHVENCQFADALAGFRGV